jgi:ribosomal protein S18 acetylase RimI-like enzyme
VGLFHRPESTGAILIAVPRCATGGFATNRRSTRLSPQVWLSGPPGYQRQKPGAKPGRAVRARPLSKQVLSPPATKRGGGNRASRASRIERRRRHACESSADLEIAYGNLMNDPLTIRPATASDRPLLRRAIIELQDHERRLHATRLPGEQIADTYLARIEHLAAENGAVLVAEIDGLFAGFVAGWVEQNDNPAETADSNRFGYISDICVMPGYLGRHIALRLLESIERHLGRTGVARLRIGSLAANTAARATYERGGFAPYEVVHEKIIPTTRKAVHADIRRIMEIRHAVRENQLSDPNSVTAADCAAFIDRAEIWVWVESGRIQGFAAGDPRDGSIFALFIDPAHEGRGIGRALLALASGTLRAAGFETATLSTDPGTRADRFYRANGWIEIGRNAKGEIVFQRQLRARP